MKDLHTEHITLIEEGNPLPFCLILNIGKGDKEQIVEINRLSVSSEDFAQYMYSVQEFRSIRISIFSNKSVMVRIIWDRLSDKLAYATPYSFILTQNIQSVTIYEQGVTEEYYPWNCGIYCFEVQFEGQSFWGGFQVIPKNLTNEQLYDVHELIHQEVKGLTLETDKKNRTYQEKSKEGGLEGVVKSVMNQVYGIEKEIQSHILNLSFRNQPPYFSNHPSQNRIKQSIQSCEAILTDLNSKEEQESLFSLEIEHLNKKLSKFKSILKHWEMIRIPKVENPPPFQRLIKAKVNRVFAKSSYSMVEEFKGSFQPFKPTYLVYEYYCYFLIFNILKGLRFIPVPLLSDQLNHILRNNVLSEPSYLILKREKWMVHIAYNDIIDHFVHTEYPLKEGLCSLEERRKPDIRVDLYLCGKERTKYLSTIIFEVKYSPLFNIYQKYSTTKAMEQLKKYWTIKYIEKNELGKTEYRRSPIYEVVCLYPGSNQHPTVLDTPVALYIQNYPRRSRGKKTVYIGMKEIRNILSDWIYEQEKVGKKWLKK